MHDTDGRPQLDDDWHRASLKYNVVFPDGHFQAPPTDSPLLNLNISGQIPLNIPNDDTGDDATVRIVVNGRGLDFMIDSSSAGSLIDWEVAREIGLPTFGQITQLPNGAHIGYETQLLSANLGPLPLSDFAIGVEDIDYTPSNNTKVVGVLGADFLSTHYFKVDYVNQVVKIFTEQQFEAAVPAGSSGIPVVLDDSVPYMTMNIGAGTSHRVLFDNSLTVSTVFGQYLRDHSGDFTDSNRGEHDEEIQRRR